MHSHCRSIVEKEELRVLVLSPRYKSEMRVEALPKHFAPELEEFESQVRGEEEA